ncbi:MAG: hypothetical protein ACXVNM_05175 [Bacteroidia bacterium]
MKALQIIIPSSFMIILLLVSGCKKNSTSKSYTPECSGTAPTFASTVSPLIISSCSNGSGCHGQGSVNGPGAFTNYTQIKNSASSIRSSIVGGSMPKNSTLTTDQKNTIVCWIDGGTINN